MYILVATIDGKRIYQGKYSYLKQAYSRISQLEIEYEFLGISKPTKYEITTGGEV